MQMDSQQSALIHRYLLGLLSEEECERFELAYFEETALFLDLLDAKEQLIDRYLRGDLSADDRRLFEQQFLSTESLRREVELRQIARNFSENNPGEKSRESKPAATPGWRDWRPLAGLRAPFFLPGAAAALLLLVAGAGLFRLMRSPSANVQIANSGAASASSQPPGIKEIELAPSLSVRSGADGNYLLNLDSSVKQARLRLRLAGKLYSTYHSDLVKRDEGMRVVASNDSLKPETTGNAPSVVWTLEANQLPTGDYLIEVQGVPEKGERAHAGNYDLSVRWR
ncbi:MAG: hypothetical protein SF339_27405 [Blastocatellia bacterium]|nr:hypothetical protein [Blastocatellia bacterium]